jgi:hypothetical protein
MKQSQKLMLTKIYPSRHFRLMRIKSQSLEMEPINKEQKKKKPYVFLQ